METCPTCMGKGKIQSSFLFTEQVEEQIKDLFDKYGRGLKLHLHPYVYAYVCRGLIRSIRHRWFVNYGIRVVENQGLGMLETRFYDAKGNIAEK